MQDGYKGNYCELRCERCNTLLAKLNCNKAMIKYKQLVCYIDFNELIIFCRICGYMNKILPRGLQNEKNRL